MYLVGAERAAMDHRVCAGCKQELSRAAFYRHMTPSVCPGRHPQPQVSTTSEVVCSLVDDQGEPGQDIMSECELDQQDGIQSDTEVDKESDPVNVYSFESVNEEHLGTEIIPDSHAEINDSNNDSRSNDNDSRVSTESEVPNPTPSPIVKIVTYIFS